jgi:hypothetical protein
LHTGYEGECGTHGSVAVIPKPAQLGAFVDALATVLDQNSRQRCRSDRRSGAAGDEETLKTE